MNSLPATQTAIVGLEDGSLGIATDVPLPELEDDTIMIKNVVVGLNPVDTKMVGKLVTPRAVTGTDCCGTIIAIGKNAKLSVPIEIGSKVFSAVQGMHSLTPRVGAFAQYSAVTAHVTLRMPEWMSFEQGASLGSGISTMGLAIFHSLKVPGYPLEPAKNPTLVLVYGGSTATGTLAIQLLKLSGLSPIATCSPSNFELVRSYGADAVFDYRSPSCTQDIRKHTKSSLRYVLDCISEPETMEFCYKCIGRFGGKYTALEPYPASLHTRSDVEPDWVLGPSLLGKDIAWPPPFQREGSLEAKEFALKWFGTAQKLLDDGRLKTHPLQTMLGGLQGVLDGMELLRNKQISGKKLVYPL